MGVCSSAVLDEQLGMPEAEHKAENKRIEDDLKADHGKEEKVNKLLLLGAGESGKSTLFKQMITLYGKGFTEKDRRSYVSIIARNTLQCAYELCRQSVERKHPVTSAKAIAAVNYILKEMKIGDTVGYMPGAVEHVRVMWADPNIQATYEERTFFQLNNSAKYFFDKLDETAAPDYLPSEADIIQCRVRTTGIVENEFVIENNRFKMFDVGGQRNERKKWIHCFEGVTAVLFVAAISEYNQQLYEDDSINRTDEALNLFENICSSKWFTETSIMLFLNKSDLFAEKLRQYPLEVTHPSFKPQDPKNPELYYEDACKYMEDLFLGRNSSKKPIYCHVTCATDKYNVDRVFQSVKDIIVRGALEGAGFV